MAAPGTTGAVPIFLHFNFDGGEAAGPVQGWSYGICNPADLLTPVAVSFEGTNTEALNGGSGPDFLAVSLPPDLRGQNNGVTVAAVVDMEGENTVQPRNYWLDAWVIYEVSETAQPCTQEGQTLTASLRVCDTLGDPPVRSIATINDASYPPAHTSEGRILVSCSGDFAILVTGGEAVPGGTVDLEVILDFNHDGGTTAGPIQGWSYGLCMELSQLEPVALSLSGSDTSTLNGGAGPDWVSLKLPHEIAGKNSGVTVGIVVDMQMSETAPPVNNWKDVVVTVRAVAETTGCDDPIAGGIISLVSPCDILGEPPVACVATVNNQSVFMGSYRSGWVRISCGVRFVRGDPNRDGQVDISDGIFILSYLFNNKPASCLDACDVNDDGNIDISDPIYLLSYLFAQGPPPLPPFPEKGADPTEDSLTCEV